MIDIWYDDEIVERREWVALAKRVLIQNQLRDNLEKTVVVIRNLNGEEVEDRIVLKPPKSSFDLEEGSFA